MKHLTMTERCMNEKYIVYEYSFREIARYIGAAPSMISREVKNNRIFISPKNPKCANIADCNIHDLCSKCLLTMIFVKYDFMLLFLLKQDTQECVREVFDIGVFIR